MGEKGHLCDFDRGMDVDISESADLPGFSHAADPGVYREWMEKEKNIQ